MALKKPAPEYENFPNLAEVMASIDAEAVGKAILTDREGKEVTLAKYDFDDAVRLTWIAAEKFLARDLYEIELEGLEIRKDMMVGIHPFKSFLDVAGTTRGLIDPFKPFAGKPVIIDWKTTKNDLKNPSEWRRRLLDSNQWMCYSEVYKAAVFIYRGLSRNGSTAELIINVPESNSKEALEYISGVGVQVNALRDGGYEVFPRNRPFACNAYGRECQYKDDCDEYTMPRQVLSPDKQLSYSFMNTFLLCPERARRESLVTDGLGSDDTLFGQCVHSGIAELYKQAYEKFGVI